MLRKKSSKSTALAIGVPHCHSACESSWIVTLSGNALSLFFHLIESFLSAEDRGSLTAEIQTGAGESGRGIQSQCRMHGRELVDLPVCRRPACLCFSFFIRGSLWRLAPDCFSTRCLRRSPAEQQSCRRDPSRREPNANAERHNRWLLLRSGTQSCAPCSLRKSLPCTFHHLLFVNWYARILKINGAYFSVVLVEGLYSSFSAVRQGRLRRISDISDSGCFVFLENSLCQKGNLMLFPLPAIRTINCPSERLKAKLARFSPCTQGKVFTFDIEPAARLLPAVLRRCILS